MRPDLIKAVELLSTNDPESVSEAIRLLQHTVYAFSMKVCGHPEDAEDTMQDVLIRSLPHLSKLSDPRAMSVWLYTVTKNRCWRVRRRGVHAPFRTLSLAELMPDGPELSSLLQSAQPNPERQVLLEEQNLQLQNIILSMPPEYRIVLVLHDIEGLDTEQVSRVLGLLPGTVRVRLHRARLFVRKAMSQLVDRVPKQRAVQKPRRKASNKKKVAVLRPAPCRETFAKLSEYLDNRLNPQSCEQMRAHIEACPACIAFIADLRRAIDRCRKLDAACDPEIAIRLRSLLTKEYLRMLHLPIPKK